MFGKALKSKFIYMQHVQNGWAIIFRAWAQISTVIKCGGAIGCTKPKILPTIIKAVVTTAQKLFLPTEDQQIKAETHHLELSWDFRLLLEKNSIPFQKNPDVSSKLDILSFPSGQS